MIKNEEDSIPRWMIIVHRCWIAITTLALLVWEHNHHLESSLKPLGVWLFATFVGGVIIIVVAMVREKYGAQK